MPTSGTLSQMTIPVLEDGSIINKTYGLGGGGGGSSVTVDTTGTASASAVSYQRIGVDSVYTEIKGTKYMETSTKTTANSIDTFTFTNSAITSTACIEVYTDVFGVAPTDMTVSGNQLTVSFASSDGVGTCRIYIK